MNLPELNQATLDEPGLNALLLDIAACTEVLEVIPKRAAQGHVPETGTLSLDDAGPLLRSRTVRGLQIRYRYENADWWDTLMVQPEGYKLVRIRHDFSGE